MNKLICLVIVFLSAVPVFAEEPAAEEIAVTWWGCMSVEVNIGDVSIVFDPYIKPDEPRFDYIFVSHDHYDHCHEPTLRKLIVPHDTTFKMLFASRACFYASRIQGPNNWSDYLLSDLSFVPRDKSMALYPKYMDRVSRHIRQQNEPQAYGGPTEVVVGRLRVEGFRSHEDPQPFEQYRDYPQFSGQWPNLGYLVTDTVTGLSFAHTGDMWNAYPEMEKMRGKVDVLFYPLGKLPEAEKVKMIEYIRPKIAIPTHYRLPEPDFPIPAKYLEVMTEEEVHDNLREACLLGWYPSPNDPPAEIEKQREAFAPFTKLVELKAGVRYILPEDLSTFRGRDD